MCKDTTHQVTNFSARLDIPVAFPRGGSARGARVAWHPGSSKEDVRSMALAKVKVSCGEGDG